MSELPGGNTIAISISESPDMAILGLAKEHLDDALAEVSRHLMATGASLIYGGDLRPGGFTEALSELVMRYRDDSGDSNAGTGVSNFLAWPVHISLPSEQVSQWASDLGGVANLICLTIQGNVLDAEERQRLSPYSPSEAEWASGLTAMREAMTQQSNVRVVLGGRVENFKGRIPGIAEEVLIAFQAEQSLFLLGGFGGCARDIAEELGLASAPAIPRLWPGRNEFARFTSDNLNNGLTQEENALLAETEHIDTAVSLILRGMLRLRSENSSNTENPA